MSFRTAAILSAVLLTLFPPVLRAGGTADRYLGYRWKPVLLSSWSGKGSAPEVLENMEAFRALADAEAEEGQGRYITDITDGFWYYASAYSWSLPEETGWKLPGRDGQVPTATSLKTAQMLSDAWHALSGPVGARLPALEKALRDTMKRLTGQDL